MILARILITFHFFDPIEGQKPPEKEIYSTKRKQLKVTKTTVKQKYFHVR